MARVLFAWEMGEGMGHLVPLRPVLEALVADGHELLVAAVDLRSARAALGHIATALVQAPVVVDARFPLGRVAEGAADLLAMNGFADADSLHGRHHAWCQLAALLKPDLLLAEHSPGALLMARTLGIPAVHAGTGFTLPPEVQPILFPGFSAGDNPAREEQHLTRFNELIVAGGGSPLERLADLYNQVADRFLLTFEELDHLGPRSGVPYLGADVPGQGDQPDWPAGDHHLFAYLKPFRGIEHFLDAVKGLGLSLLMVPDGIDPALLERYACANLRVVNRRQNMQTVIEQADLLVFNGNHGTAAAGLLGGVPMLAFPKHQEQESCARRMAAAGLGSVLMGDHRKKVRPLLEAMLQSATQKASSRERAARYHDFDYRNSIARMVTALEKLL